MCHGCHGPTNENCEYCVEHAYKDENGECQCDPLWYTDYCNLPYETCNINCRTCDVTVDADACTSCWAGFFPDAEGNCVLCDPACSTCDGPSSSDCTACHDGWFLDGSECTACDGCCATCETSSQNCTSCWADSFLDGNDCKCTSGYRDPNYLWKCFDECPTGMSW
jgi:hypothetical protein